MRVFSNAFSIVELTNHYLVTTYMHVTEFWKMVPSNSNACNLCTRTYTFPKYFLNISDTFNYELHIVANNDLRIQSPLHVAVFKSCLCVINEFVMNLAKIMTLI